MPPPARPAMNALEFHRQFQNVLFSYPYEETRKIENEKMIPYAQVYCLYMYYIYAGTDGKTYMYEYEQARCAEIIKQQQDGTSQPVSHYTHPNQG